MDISALTNVSSEYIKQAVNEYTKTDDSDDKDFASILNTSMNLIDETNDYQNAAEEAEIQFTLGESTSTHDLTVAQEKANIALQYTVAVRDKLLEAYQTIMQMQM